MQEPLIQQFAEFGLAALVGFVLGLEREMAGSENPHAGTRDFILIALIGAVSGYIAQLFDSPWLIMTGFLGAISLLLSGYWIDRNRDTGITTEVAVILTFFLGVLIVNDVKEVAIAIAIVTLVILSQKKAIQSMTSRLQINELQAGIKFLVITFIILPVFPNQQLSDYLVAPLGVVQSYQSTSGIMVIEPGKVEIPEKGDELHLFDVSANKIGKLIVEFSDKARITGNLVEQQQAPIEMNMQVERSVNIPWLHNMLGALNPYKIWLIVVLVSMISLVGYIAVKILGPGAGIGITGLIGGLASSTVTTVSFAKRSLESPGFNRSFAVAILLASSIMFPRLLLEIAIVNQDMMKNMAFPIIVMGGTGIVVALFFSLMSKRQKAENTTVMQLTNPFCLKSAVTFGLVFSLILILTRMATIYLGESWLPLVAIISGLVDVDAIAFSLSDAQKAGIITLDWASFNLVLGAISNTVVKLFFVFTLGDRQLFRQITVSFLIVCSVGILTTALYYDF